MPLAFGPQSLIHAAEIGITLRGDQRHVIKGMAQTRGYNRAASRLVSACNFCLVTRATSPCVRNTR